MSYKDIIKVNLSKIKVALAQNVNLYLFGAGQSCRDFIKEFSLKDEIQGVFDNNEKKAGLYVEHIIIYDLIYLKKIPKNSIFIITSIYMKEIKNQLESSGFNNIFCFYEVGGYVGQQYKGIGTDRVQYSHLPLLKDQLLKVKEVKEVLADELSKSILKRIVALREQTSPFYGYDYLDECDNTGGGVLTFSENEVMVDAGAYNGDTIEYFKKSTNNKFKKIYAFEPDEKNFKLLSLKVHHDKRIQLINSGLWSKNDYLFFTDENNDTSHFSKQGRKKVFVQSLDSLISEPVTFIKMDIEGAELEALNGAKELIKKYRPKLSIAIYHRYNDLWDIPMWIHRYVPEYQFYIRQQSFSQSETILYAKVKDKD